MQFQQLFIISFPCNEGSINRLTYRYVTVYELTTSFCINSILQMQELKLGEFVTQSCVMSN